MLFFLPRAGRTQKKITKNKKQNSNLPRRYGEHRGKLQEIKSQKSNLPRRHGEHRGKLQKSKNKTQIYHGGIENTRDY